MKDLYDDDGKQGRKTRIVSVVAIASIALILLSSFIYTQNATNKALMAGREEGFWYVVNRLKDAGLEVNVDQNLDGSYNVHFSLPMKGMEFNAKFELHMTVRHYRDGVLLSETYHAMSLTTLGKNWIEGILGDTVGADVAKYIGSSNSSDTFSAAWTVLPDEITTDGLSRAAGTYASTGDGTWNCTKSFSVTGTNATKLYGLYYASTGSYLLAAEQQGEGAQKNLNSGDTLGFYTLLV